MTFSDVVFECYIKLFEGISNYNDYCECQKTETINVMISLQKILYAVNQLNANEELTDVAIQGIKLTCDLDYQKALCGMEFCDSDSDSD